MSNENVARLRQLSLPSVVSLGENVVAAVFSNMKVIPALHMVGSAITSGEIGGGTVIADSSSGTFAISLAVAGAAYGVRVHLVGDSGLDLSVRARLDLLGASYEIIPPDQDGYTAAARLARLETYVKSVPNAYLMRQYDNPRSVEGYAVITDHVVQQLAGRAVDMVVSPVGSGGNAAGFTLRLRSLGHPVELVGVDTQGSVLFGCRRGSSMLRGMGNSITPGNLCHELFDDIHWCPPSLAFSMAREVYARMGLDIGPTSGAAFVVAKWVAHRNPKRTVLVIFPDNGERYRNDVLSASWLEARGLLVDPWTAIPAHVSHPREVSDKWCFLKWARRALVDVAGIASAHSCQGLYADPG